MEAPEVNLPFLAVHWCLGTKCTDGKWSCSLQGNGFQNSGELGLRVIQALACTRYFQKYFQTQISTSADFKELESMGMEIEGALWFPYANLLFTR